MLRWNCFTGNVIEGEIRGRGKAEGRQLSIISRKKAHIKLCVVKAHVSS